MPSSQAHMFIVTPLLKCQLGTTRSQQASFVVPSCRFYDISVYSSWWVDKLTNC